MKKTLKLQRSESFYIREGWIEKVFSAYRDKKFGTFNSKSGTSVLGIGSNMVKSLRYWVEACRLVESFGKDSFELSNKGKLIYERDPYLETVFSWGLLHYWLVSNKDQAPVFYSVFNSTSVNQIRRKETASILASMYEEDGFENPNLLSIQKDVTTLISSYVSEDDILRTPEENISCPFSRLRLLRQTSRDQYEKNCIPYSCIDYRLLFICLRERYANGSFNIDDALIEEGSPVLCFNIDRVTFLSLLTEMKKSGLIELNRTAGLNVAYMKSDCSDEMLFDDYIFERKGRIYL